MEIFELVDEHLMISHHFRSLHQKTDDLKIAKTSFIFDLIRFSKRLLSLKTGCNSSINVAIENFLHLADQLVEQLPLQCFCIRKLIDQVFQKVP